MPERSRLFNGIQACRGIAALIVVFHHVQGLMRKMGEDPSFGRLFAFGHSGVDFFFVLSGFIVLYAHYRDIGVRERLRQYVWKRLTRIYPIYWFLCLFLVPSVVLVPSLAVNSAKNDAWLVIRSLLLVPQVDAPFLGVTWSLQNEILFYSIFGLVIAHRGLGLALLGGWTAFLVVSLPAYQKYPFPFQFLLNPHNLEFALGMLAAVIVRTEVSVPRPRLLAIIGAAGFLLTGLVDMHVPELALPHLTLPYGISSALIVLGLVKLEQHGQLFRSRLLTVLGEASYSIYLIHYPVVLVCLRLLASLKEPGETLPAGMFLYLSGVATIAGIVLFVTVERPMLNWIRLRTLSFSWQGLTLQRASKGT